MVRTFQRFRKCPEEGKNCEKENRLEGRNIRRRRNNGEREGKGGG